MLDSAFVHEICTLKGKIPISNTVAKQTNRSTWLDVDNVHRGNAIYFTFS